MRGRRGSFFVPTAPRRVTFLVSLLIMAAVLVSLKVHLPVGHVFVATHRFWLAVAAYALLAVGVLLPGV